MHALAIVVLLPVQLVGNLFINATVSNVKVKLWYNHGTHSHEFVHQFTFRDEFL